MYEKIQHPKTGKWHNINSSLGNKLVKGYAKKINQTGGNFYTQLLDVLNTYQRLEKEYITHQSGLEKYSMNQSEYSNIMEKLVNVGDAIDNLLSTDKRRNESHFENANKTRWPSGIKRIDNAIKANRARLIKMHEQTIVTGFSTETVGYGKSRVASGFGKSRLPTSATVGYGKSRLPTSATVGYGKSRLPTSATVGYGKSRVRPSTAAAAASAARKAASAAAAAPARRRPSHPAAAPAASLFDQPSRGTRPPGRASAVQSQIEELERQTRQANGQLASNLQQQQQDKLDQAALAKARLERGQALAALYAAQDKARAQQPSLYNRGNFFAGVGYGAGARAPAHPPAAPATGGLFGPDPLPVIPSFGPKGFGDGHNSPVYIGQRAQWKARRAAGAPGPADFPGFG